MHQGIIARSRSATPPQQATKGLGVSHRHPHGACAPLSLTPGLALAVLPRGQGRGAVSQFAYALASRVVFLIVARTHGPAWYARSGPALEKPGKNISVSPGGRRLRGDDTVRDGAALRPAVACCCRNVDSSFAHFAGGVVGVARAVVPAPHALLAGGVAGVARSVALKPAFPPRLGGRRVGYSVLGWARRSPTLSWRPERRRRLGKVAHHPQLISQKALSPFQISTGC